MKGTQRKIKKQEAAELLKQMSPAQVLKLAKVMRAAYVHQVVNTQRELNPALLRDIDKGIALLTKRS